MTRTNYLLVLFSALLMGLFSFNEGHAQGWDTVPGTSGLNRVFQAFPKANNGIILLYTDGIPGLDNPKRTIREANWSNNQLSYSPSHYEASFWVDSIEVQGCFMVDTLTFIPVVAYSGLVDTLHLLVFKHGVGFEREVSFFSEKLRPGVARVWDIAAVSNRIYIGGNLFGHNNRNQLLRIPPNRDTVEVATHVSGSIMAMEVLGDSLYVGGTLDSAGTVPVNNFFKFWGLNNIVPVWALPPVRQMTSDGTNIWMLVMNNSVSYDILDFSGQSYKFNLTGGLNALQLLFYGSNKYLLLNDQSNTRFPPNLYRLESNNNWRAVDLPFDLVEKTGVLASPAIGLVAFNKDTVNKSLMRYNKGLIYGSMFVDMNGNCQKEINEPFCINYSVFNVFNNSSINGYHVINDYRYSLDVQDDSFYLQVNPYERQLLVAPSCVDDLVGRIAGLGNKEVNLPMVFTGNSKLRSRLDANLGWRARQGFEETYNLHLSNQALPWNCDIILQFQDSFEVIEVPPSFVALGNNRYRVPVNMDPFDQVDYRIKLKAGIEVPPNTVWKIWTYASCPRVFEGDTLEMIIRGAFDPNDKQVFPAGPLAKGTSNLGYHIRFQNTGTDTAYRVRIIDTVDTNLPLRDLRIRTASHHMRIEVKKNVLYFTFDDILLPDSTTDLEGSQGFVRYETQIHPSFGEEDSITNTAYIFFDYQKPIITNKVVSRLDKKSDVPGGGKPDDKWFMYPNPSHDKVFVKNEGHREEFFALISMKGIPLMELTLLPGETGTFDVSQLARGPYLICSGSGQVKRLVVFK